ncbi:hypothetical protein ACFO5T_05600 [Dokdonia genika]|uniref:Uncharacterized protein n=1 Tax=Dokdonia genika TaxID=308113 RepID=A0ABV9L7G4_9FLAO
MKSFPFLIILLIITSSCGSAKLNHQYRNPNTINIKINKALIIGVVADTDLRNLYEGTIKRAFKKRGIEAERSIDFF